MSDGKAAEKNEDLSRKKVDSSPELAAEAAGRIGDNSVRLNTPSSPTESTVLKELHVSGSVDERDKDERKKRRENEDEQHLLNPVSISGNPSEQNWRDQELAKAKKQHEIAELERKAHSSGSGNELSPVSLQDAKVPVKDAAQIQFEEQMAKIKHDQAIADLEKRMHSSAATSGTDVPKIETPKSTVSSNNSEIEWRQKELERLQREKTIAEQEKAMHSSAPPKVNSNTSEMEWRQKELERLQKEKTIAEQEKAMHSSTPPKANSNASEQEWRDKELQRLKKEQDIAALEKQMHSSAQPAQKPGTAGSNSNNSEIEWRQKELQRLKKEQEISQLEKQNHSSAPPVARPVQETAKPKTEGTPKVVEAAKPGEPAKPRTEPKTEPRTEPKKESASTANKPETKSKADTPVAQNAARRENPAAEVKKVEQQKTTFSEPKAAQTLARQSVTPTENSQKTASKAQEQVPKLKSESALAPVLDRHLAQQPINKPEAEKKTVLNLSTVSSLAADLRPRPDTALARISSAIPYAALSRQSNPLEHGKVESKSLPGQNKDSCREDAQKAIKTALPATVKAIDNAAAAKHFDPIRVTALNLSPERQRSSHIGSDGVAKSLAMAGSIKTALHSSPQHETPRPLNLTVRAQVGSIASVVTPGRAQFVPGRVAGAGDTSLTNAAQPGRRIASSTAAGQIDQIINNRNIGAQNNPVDLVPVRYVSIAGKNESLISDLSGIKRGICRTQDGRQMPGVELVMGALITSAAIAKARRGGMHESELVDDHSGGRKLTWLQAFILDRQKKQKDNREDSNDSDPLMLALEVFNENLKADQEKKASEMQRKQEASALQQRSSNTPLRQKYEVAREDTLDRLAVKLYNDRSVSWLIADINQGKIKESTVEDERVVELYVGQIIELPTAEEAEHYLQELSKRKSKWETASGRKLITIVNNAGENSDILQDILGKIV